MRAPHRRASQRPKLHALRSIRREEDMEARRLGAPGASFGTRESVYLHLPYISISRISLPRLEHCACSQPCTVCAPLSRVTTYPSPRRHTAPQWHTAQHIVF